MRKTKKEGFRPERWAALRSDEFVEQRVRLSHLVSPGDIAKGGCAALIRPREIFDGGNGSFEMKKL